MISNTHRGSFSSTRWTSSWYFFTEYHFNNFSILDFLHFLSIWSHHISIYWYFTYIFTFRSETAPLLWTLLLSSRSAWWDWSWIYLIQLFVTLSCKYRSASERSNRQSKPLCSRASWITFQQWSQIFGYFTIWIIRRYSKTVIINTGLRSWKGRRCALWCRVCRFLIEPKPRW